MNEHFPHVCPITLEPFIHPVIAYDGFIYERDALVALTNGKSTIQSPMTNVEMKSDYISCFSIHKMYDRPWPPQANFDIQSFQAKFAEIGTSIEETCRNLSRNEITLSDNFPIQYTSEHGYVKAVQILLTHPCGVVDPSANDNYAIKWASANGYVEVVKMLLADQRVDPSADNIGAIGRASENGQLEVVKLLLADPRVDPSDDDNYAIGMASQNGHVEVVKLLLVHPKVDPSADNNYAISQASHPGHVEVVKLLLAHPKVDPSDDDNCAIKCASEKGHEKIVKLLLADPRVDPEAGLTNVAFHIENRKVITMLLLAAKKRQT